jgi:hypothetical protein
VITRNRLLGIIVLLAGLTAGYFASRVVQRLHADFHSDLPVYYSREEIPAASVANFCTIYESSTDQFKQVLNQGQDAIREAARRRQVLQQSKERVTTNPEAYEQLILQSEREIDILRLQDYYSQFYLHYCRWLDAGNAQSAVKYKLALGQFSATLDYILETQQEYPVLTDREIEELRSVIRIAEQSNRTIRWAKVVVVILLFLLVMGIPHLIRDSGYKRFAGSLYFDALFRPNYISDLNRWHSTKSLALSLLLLYMFGFVISSSFISWRIPLVFGVLGLIPVMVLTGLSGIRGKFSALIVTYMAPKMLVLIMVLGLVAIRGPNYFWYLIWGSELFRTLFISILFLLVFRKFHVNVILVRKWGHRNQRGSAALVCLALGLQLLIAGALMYWFGPEESLATLNRELLLLPTYLMGSPASFLNWLMFLAGILTISALSTFIFNRRKKHVPSNRAKS